jgi:hypothetical protein
MTFARIRPFGNWLDGGTLDETELEQFDDHLSKAIDGDGGGAYAPSAQLIIGGAFAFKLTTGLDVDADAGVSGSLTVETNLLVDGDAALGGDVGVVGAATFAGVATFNDNSIFNGLVAFNDTVTADTLLATVLGVSGGASIAGGLAADTVTPGEIILSGTSKGIREHVVYGPDADHTYSVGDATVIVAGAVPALTAGRAYKLNDATSVGTKIKILNWNGSFDITIKNQSGSNIGIAPKLVTAGVPGIAEMMWYDSTGTGNSWGATERHT